MNCMYYQLTFEPLLLYQVQNVHILCHLEKYTKGSNSREKGGNLYIDVSIIKQKCGISRHSTRGTIMLRLILIKNDLIQNRDSSSF